MCCSLLHLYTHVLDPSFRKPYQNTNRWFTTLVNQPEFKAVIGDVKHCEKMAQFDAKKYAEIHGGKGGKKEGKKEPKKEEKKEEPKAKEAKPAPEAGGDTAEAPKKDKDPFAKFPKG